MRNYINLTDSSTGIDIDFAKYNRIFRKGGIMLNRF